MGDEEDAKSGAGKLAHDVAKFELTSDVEGVAGLVEEQCLWVVNQGASDERAFGFTGRHFEDRAIRKMGDAHAGQGVVRAGVMFGMRLVIGENAGAAEEAGKDDVETGGIGGASREEIGGDDAEGRAEFEDIPERAAQDGDRGIFALKRVALAREGLDEGGFAGAVGAEDADMFADSDAKRQAVEGDVLAAKDSDVLQVEQRRGHRRKFTL